MQHGATGDPERTISGEWSGKRSKRSKERNKGWSLDEVLFYKQELDGKEHVKCGMPVHYRQEGKVQL